MMNRCAELLFWVGRYIERAENHTRLIDVNYHLRHELNSGENEQAYMWERLVAVLGDADTFKANYLNINEQTVLQFLTFERMNHNSIFSCVYKSRNNMRALRQLLQDELWDTVNAFYLWLKDEDIYTVMEKSPYIFYQRVREWLSLFNGTAESIMLREKEWHFIQAGKHLERAENTIRILHTVYTNLIQDGFLFHDEEHYNRLIVLLKSVGGYEAFRKCYADHVTLANVTEFMMLHPGFPRSVHFALTSLEGSLQAIKQQDFNFTVLSDRAIHLTAKIKEILSGLNEEQDGLKLLYEMLESCHQLGASISKTFFREELVGA